MTKLNNKAIAVIPTFNESQNIIILIDKLISIGVHVLVVDDSSPDGTFELVQQHNQFNNNLFGSLFELCKLIKSFKTSPRPISVFDI